MLRAIFLYLSVAGWAKKLITAFPPARRATRRFVAGESIGEALNAAHALNQKNMLVSLDNLGENVYTEPEARKATDHYLKLIDSINQAKVKASCSLKLTQLGLDISEDLCVQNLREILTRAKATNMEITIDMESTDYTERTLKIYRMLHQDYEFSNLATVIQAYLYRSEADMQALAQEGATIRLCKGAYKEPADKAFPKKADVDVNYVTLMQQFMSPENRAKGAYLQLATHDLSIIQAAEEFIRQNNIPKNQFEFQMLYGIRSGTQEELVKKGYTVRIYVPYGSEWYPYFMRRLAERPANVWFILKNLMAR